MPELPLILVTNDDGLNSPGLQAAAEAVADLGELLIAAPATQQTAMGRAFVRDARSGTIERATISVAGCDMPAYAISGSPAMAVTHAVLELAERPISLCVSGINYGENIGAAIAASGTIGAALEADIYDIPGVAASITTQVSEWRTFGPVNWTTAKHFTRLLAQQVLEEGMPDGASVLNLNVPQGATPRTELRKTVQSRQRYYVLNRPVLGRPLDQPYELVVQVAVDWDRLEPGTDVYAIAVDEVVSVTPLTWQMTADTDWTPRARALARAVAAERAGPAGSVHSVSTLAVVRGPARRESNAHWRFRGPLSCPLDHGPGRRTRGSNPTSAVLQTASRAGESCVAVSPARLERATCCSGNSRAFLLRHGDMRPPEAAVAGRACQGRDSNPQWPGGRRLYRTLRCLLRDPGVG